VITDSPPRSAKARRQYDESDARRVLELPAATPLQRDAERLRAALETERAVIVRVAGQAMLDRLADFYSVPATRLRVLGVRPHRVHDGQLAYELHGDYDHESGVIRAWMRTAIREKVTSYRGLLNTLVHELAHHLDVHLFGWPETSHTRGFYGRVDELYHLALATPAERRKPLVWIKTGSRWRVDWTKLR
jgi:hypothetical protein